MPTTIYGERSYAIISSIGATVQRYACNGKEIIFPFLNVGDECRGGIPICFPFFGQRGWLRNQKLDIVRISASEVVFAGKNKKTHTFPWLLEYQVTIQIESDGLNLQLIARRLHDGNLFQLPVNPSFQPCFWSNPDSDDRCIARCLARVGERIITEYSKQSWKCPVDSPILINSGVQTVKMTLGGNFKQNSSLIHWSDNPNAYFCVEPKLTDDNLLTNPNGGRFLGGDDVFDNQDTGSFLDQEEEMEISMCLAVV